MDLDCSLNGVCVAGTCQCDAAWEGEQCERFATLPASPTADVKEAATSTWGTGTLAGQLEGEYGCVLPDEVMFRETTTLRVLTILVKEGFDEETYSRTVAAFEIETVTIKERGGGDPLIENCPCCLLCPCYKTRKV